MKLKIQYTIDESALPKELQNLFERKRHRFENALSYSSEGLLNSIDSQDYVVAREQVSTLRKQLYDFDLVLDDIDNILQGYIEYKQPRPSDETITDVLEEED